MLTTNNASVPIEIRTYSPDEGSVNGRTVSRGTHSTIHDACIALTVPFAQHAGAPVLTHAVDSIGAPAEYWLQVHPDGRATATDLRPQAELVEQPFSGNQETSQVHPADHPVTNAVPPVVSFADRRASEATVGRERRSESRRRHAMPVEVVPVETVPSEAVPLDAVSLNPVSLNAVSLSAVPVEAEDQRLASVAAGVVPVEPFFGTTGTPAPVRVAAPFSVVRPEVQSAVQPAAQLTGRHQPAGDIPTTATVPAPPTRQNPSAPPTLGDLLGTRPPPPTGPAQLGWRATVRRLTAGLVKPGPGAEELKRRKAVAAVQRSLSGPKTIAVINPKGGANKTTATLLIAATFGIHRGGYTLAWDNNETRGTMGWRASQGRHTNTAVDLLRELDRFQDARSARVGDLDNFVRSQGSAQFDVLASDEDATSAASIDAEAFTALHQSLSRFYRVMVVDTGNNMRASNWSAAVAAADQIVIVSTIREDTAQSAAWVADALNEKGSHEKGYAEKVSSAVTILAAPSVRPDPALTGRLESHFGRLTRAVVQVPFDPSLVSGGPIAIEALSPASRDAWLQATALVADGL